MRAHTLEDDVEALDAGTAYAELAEVALTIVSGEDARAWLNDLVTTDVRGLERSGTRPSLLLSPTGHVRASFHVLALGDRDLALAQPPGQPERISDALAPYVLSSDVTLSPSRLRLFAVPGGATPPAPFGDAFRPSVLGGGYDLLVGGSDEEALEHVRGSLSAAGLRAVGAGAVEARRIGRGEPAFPADLDPSSVPAEAGLDDGPTTDREKGCFLGQESVAKVANLGHPPRVVVGVTASGPVRAGDGVRLADDGEVGVVTSATRGAAIVRVRWDARSGRLVTERGTPLARR